MKPFIPLSLAVLAAACSVGTEPGSEIAAASGCGEDADGVVVVDAWVRAATADRPATAAYMTLCNAGETLITLNAAASPAATAVELHETKRAADGVVSMSPVAALPLAPDAPVVLAPGGAHIMLIGLAGALEPGMTTPITLTFDGRDPIIVEAVVREAAPGDDRHH